MSAVFLQFYQAEKCASIGPALDFSASIEVSAIKAPTTYGSMLEAGRLSSMYPFPLALAVLDGTRNDAARLATP